MSRVEVLPTRVEFHYDNQHLTKEDAQSWLNVWHQRQEQLKVSKLAGAMSNAEPSRVNQHAK